MTRKVRGGGVPLPNTAGLSATALYEDKYITLLESYAMSRFKWEGLPDTVDERFLERILMIYGEAVFFKYGGSLMATKVVHQGPSNVYDNWTQYESIGNNNWNHRIPDGQGVLVYDSLTRRSKYQTLRLFAGELAELDTIARTNRSQQRHLVVLSGPEENAADLRKLRKDLEGDEFITVQYKKMTESGKGIEAIDLNVDYMAALFHADRASLMNEFYMMYGIEHVAYQKNAHQNDSETEITNSAVARTREDALVPRQQAAEAIGKLFGVEVTVKFRDDEERMMQERKSGDDSDAD